MPESAVVITNPLVEHPGLSQVAFAVLLVVGPLVGARLVHRRRCVWWAAGASCVPGAVLTLAPVDRELFERCASGWVLPTPGRVELAANVVLFVAPCLFAAVASRRPLVVAVVGSAVSALIEGLQAAVLALGRSCDTNDWLSNTIGSVIGATLGGIALRIGRSKVRSAPRGGATP